MTVEELTKFIDQTHDLNDNALKKALDLFDKQSIKLNTSISTNSTNNLLLLIYHELRDVNRNIIKMEFKVNELINLQTICNSQLVDNTNTLINNSNKENKT